MASLVLSLLEEEAKERGGRLPSRKRRLHAEGGLSHNSPEREETATAAAAPVGAADISSQEHPPSAEPFTSEAVSSPPLGGVPGVSVSTRRRAARLAFSNLSPSFTAAHAPEGSSPKAKIRGFAENRGCMQRRREGRGGALNGTANRKFSSQQQVGPDSPKSSSSNRVAVGQDSPSSDPRPSSNSSTSSGGARLHANNKRRCGAAGERARLAALRERLPVWQHRDELRLKVEQHQVTLVVGETGSGKTTQVPQLLLEWGLCPSGWVAVSQPRRVAAVSLARRVAAEVGDSEVGGSVGYAVRFERRVSSKTRVCFMTDGMLVREALVDPLLRRVSALVLDEVHERAVQTDFLLGFAKQLATKRPELKIVLMSATLETEKLSRFFPEAAVLTIPGNTFPLQTFYLSEPQEDFLESPWLHMDRVYADANRNTLNDRRLSCLHPSRRQAAMLSVLQIHLGESGEGDVLVFLPGQEEIETLASMLRSKLKLLEAFAAKFTQKCEGKSEVEFSVRLGDQVYRHHKMQRLLVCPIYAALPFDKQQQVLMPAPPQYSRKAVLATNIAETSLTVSGIRFVVDTGLCRAKARDHRTFTEALVLQDSAKQRGGRAGREAPGTVYRLYTEECFHKMQPHKTPEILCCDLSQLFLQLKAASFLQALRVSNPLDFPLLDAPPRDAFSSAGRHLYRLEAIDEQGEITPLGRKLTALPLPPQLGAMVLAAVTLDCAEAALTLAAMLSAENVWSTPFALSREASSALTKARKRFSDPESDHLTLVGAYNHWLEADDQQAFCREAGLQHSSMLRARAIREQLQEALSPVLNQGYKGKKSDVLEEPTDPQQLALNLRRCIAKSCWQQAARLQPETRQFVTAVHRQTVKIHPASVLSGAATLPQ
ncbi:hypothetical protein ACSSS7_005074 [Eimeria intestinalis]